MVTHSDCDPTEGGVVRYRYDKSGPFVEYRYDILIVTVLFMRHDKLVVVPNAPSTADKSQSLTNNVNWVILVHPDWQMYVYI